MIDYFALALGHGLMAIALLHLVMRDGLDVDPLIGGIKDAIRQKRMDASVAGRNAARRKKVEKQAGGPMRSSSASDSADRTRSSSASGSAKKNPG
ncbi:MAG: hypothetical protein AAGK01_07130 [Pseudomonadota bacterium]